MPGYVENQRLQAGLHQGHAHRPLPEPPRPPVPPEQTLPPGAARPHPPGTRLDIPLIALPPPGRNREEDFLAAGFALRPQPGTQSGVNRIPAAASGSALNHPLDPLASPMLPEPHRPSMDSTGSHPDSEGLPPNRTAAGGRRVDGPEDFNAYENKRVEQAEKAIKLAKIAIGATVAVGVTGVVLAGLNFGSKSDTPPPPPPA